MPEKVATELDGVVQRSSDSVARYGGEEFAVVLPGTDAKGAEKVVECLRSAVEQLKIPHEYSSTSDYVTISAGVSVVRPKKEGSTEELIAMADKALYKAKEEGRNRYHIIS